MSFRDTLFEVSRKTNFEELVWEKMKPSLIKIASDRHPKGCHVRFIGAGNTFIESMKTVMRKDGIPVFTYSNKNDDSYEMGIIYWDYAEPIRNPEQHKYTDVSDISLEVTLSQDKAITIEEVKLNSEHRNENYSYIS